MQEFTLYTSNSREVEKNIIYPNKRIIHNVDEFREAMRFDCIFGEMKGNHRGEDYFISTDTVMHDLDNTHSDDPSEWKTLDDVVEAFPNVGFYYVQSRNYMKVKKKINDKTGAVTYQEPRERYHIAFPRKNKATSYADAKETMLNIVGLFPLFDMGAVKPVQPMYGVADPVVGFVDGELCIDEYIQSIPDLGERINKNLREYMDKMAAGDYSSTDENQKNIKALCDHFGINTAGNKSSESSSNNHIAIDDNWIEEEEQKQQVEWFKNWAKSHDQQIIDTYGIDSERHKKAVVFCVRCPWEDEHSMNGPDNESVVIVNRSGKLNYLCRHSHGFRLSWTKYREEVEKKHTKPAKQDREEKQPAPAEKPPAVCGLLPISGRDLQKKILPEKIYAVDGIFPEGYTVFSAPFKAGKSWLALQACIAVAAGIDFLGQKTTQGTVLYLALEDNEKTGQERLNKVLNNELAPEGFYYVFNPQYDPEKPSNKQECVPTLDNGLLEFLDKICEEHKDMRLIIIDVLGLIEYDLKKSESAYKHDYRTGSALKRWAESHSVAVCSITHTTKSPHLNDVFMNTTGTNGVTGAADAILTMIRERGRNDAVLAITGRSVKTRYLKMHFDDDSCIWEFDGLTSPDERATEKREEEAAERLEEYQTSNIREAVIRIADHTDAEDLTAYRAAEVKDQAREMGVYLLETNKDIGLFLHMYQNYFMERDGVAVEIIKNGSGSKQYRFKRWEKCITDET